ncbi:hypothetical protein FVB32_09470 [Flagellimonas hymeniacidonis]|uniref:Uncharacterized protein n=1 Tax=Flagellimonas hymeniacidonis TaxID=2603628 RepID=A0A5C8UZ83_9FLAO|nr:hypothetical protein [Flagellimonas hymeniacidonis]TXN34823.1 hypothetical protein FVB32_09470 [Flagellimonas hymeniacidonis]
MKKAILPFLLVAMIGVGLVSMNSFSGKNYFLQKSDINENEDADYATKYSDCINMENSPRFSKSKAELALIDQNAFIDEVNGCLKKYRLSLDSTVKNLSTIDAHEFLHKEYERCKTKISDKSLSEIEIYYHLGIMQICYDQDKSLNLDSDNVAKL